MDKKKQLIVPEKAHHVLMVLHMNQGQFLKKNFSRKEMFFWIENRMNIPTTGVGLDSGMSPW
jgi:hypothetical protein